MIPSQIPALERHSNSWIIVHPFKEKALRETWNRSIAQEAFERGYRVFTSAQWLVRLNAKASS